MTPRIHLALSACLALALYAAPAQAASITVAEFRWETNVIPGLGCDALDPDCVPIDPLAQSLFSLTGLWDYDEVAAPALSGSVALDGTAFIPWLEIDGSAGFDQFATDGIPLLAATTIVFDFLGESRSLGASLLAPGAILLTFDYDAPPPPNPVPEPGTCALLGGGLAVFSRALVRRHRANADRVR